MSTLGRADLAEVQSQHWWFRVRRRLVGDVVGELLPDDELVRIVDIGCGTSGNAAHLVSNTCDVLGMDISPETIDVARERFPEATFRVAGDPEEMAAALTGADLLLLMDVLEHVPDDHRFFSTLVAGLDPGAHVLVTVPADAELWSAHDVASDHWRRYSRGQLLRVFEGLPLELRTFGPLNRRLYHPIRFFRRMRPSEEGGEGDVQMPSAPVNWLLDAIFDSERPRIRRTLAGGADMPDRRGVSLVAVLTRLEGPCEVRSRPSDAEPDLHDPTAESRDRG